MARAPRCAKGGGDKLQLAALVAQSTTYPASHADAVSAMIVSFPIIVMTLALVVNVARRVLGRATASRSLARAAAVGGAAARRGRPRRL